METKTNKKSEEVPTYDWNDIKAAVDDSWLDQFPDADKWRELGALIP